MKIKSIKVLLFSLLLCAFFSVPALGAVTEPTANPQDEILSTTVLTTTEVATTSVEDTTESLTTEHIFTTSENALTTVDTQSESTNDKLDRITFILLFFISVMTALGVCYLLYKSVYNFMFY